MNHNSTEGGRPGWPSDWKDGDPFYLSECGLLTILTGMTRSCQLNEDFVCAESCSGEKLVGAGLLRQRDSGFYSISLLKT